jgi:hypothetical protein
MQNGGIPPLVHCSSTHRPTRPWLGDRKRVFVFTYQALRDFTDEYQTEEVRDLMCARDPVRGVRRKMNEKGGVVRSKCLKCTGSNWYQRRNNARRAREWAKCPRVRTCAPRMRA